jgi:hypothetical protein
MGVYMTQISISACEKLLARMKMKFCYSPWHKNVIEKYGIFYDCFEEI